ncbi:hypothetical protein ABGB18_28795 [Nonomuraea sp. B12E4]|uniref:hypothetical protein n=1 Tax=Nonomuraea sp. B12E4 TaxID=3153564 RepID=UPI00325C8E7B
MAESGTPEKALRHPDVEIIVNLTIPAAHAEVSAAALDAGKHAGHRPLGTRRRPAPRVRPAPCHVLDTMAAISESIESRRTVEVESRALVTDSIPETWDPYARTL